MCGIAGIIDRSGKPIDAAVVAEMVKRLKHRGPDESGTFHTENCSLGHARLSIVDLAGGKQPIESEDGSVTLIVNGEIYNHRAIRKNLEQRGHKFRTKSDSEVILHLYEELGEKCAKELNGMFAFAIWDAKAKKLVLGRDRFGEKPLVYFERNGFIAFSSELNSLTAVKEVPRKIDIESLNQYLSFLAVQSPRTIYEGVKRLPPAHVLVSDASGVRLERYWSLSCNTQERKLEDISADVRTAVERAVQMRLLSDVPIGAFLSGGIDSSIVVALMSRFVGKIRTFSIGFGDKDYDELEYARLVAERYETQHTEFLVTPKAAEVLPVLAKHYGEPFADPSAIPTYYLAKMTGEHVKVALTGDGSDEAFGGYPRHLAAKACGRFDHVPGLPGALHLFGKILPYGNDRKSALTRMKLLFDAMRLPPAHRHAAWLSYISEQNKKQLYSPMYAEKIGGLNVNADFERAYANCRSDAATAAMFADITAYLPSDPLVKMDIAAMANGLETRAPLLDHDVIELAFRIPSHYKLHGRQGKQVLRHAFRDLLPQKILTRGKMGFGVPIARWLRDDLSGFAKATLLGGSPALKTIFSCERISKMLDEHTAGRRDHAYPLWTLICFELWAREFNPELPN